MIMVRRKKQRGFTLIELLMVVLIVGILAAVGVPMYLGYARDARMSEGKSLLGSLWTALRGCAQVTQGTACASSNQFSRIGIGTDGQAANSQWDITSETPTVTLETDNTYTLSAALSTAGIGGATTGLLVHFNYGGGVGSFTCSSDGTDPPADPC